MIMGERVPTFGGIFYGYINVGKYFSPMEHLRRKQSRNHLTILTINIGELTGNGWLQYVFFLWRLSWYFQYRLSGFFVHVCLKQKPSIHGSCDQFVGSDMSIKVQLMMDLMVVFEGSRYPDIQTPPPQKKKHQVIQSDLFLDGEVTFSRVKWPPTRIELEHGPPGKRRFRTLGIFLRFHVCFRESISYNHPPRTARLAPSAFSCKWSSSPEPKWRATCMGPTPQGGPRADRYTWSWPTPINGLFMTWVTGVISPYLYRSYLHPIYFHSKDPTLVSGVISTTFFWWRLFTPCWSGYGIRILQARRHSFHTWP